VLLAACDAPTPAPPAVRLLHTFGPDETAALDGLARERGTPFEGRLVPFARGQQAIAEVLDGGADCPHAIRIDATWLPGLAARDALAPVPATLQSNDWLDEARALGAIGDAMIGVPQSIDGLVAVRRGKPPPVSQTLDAWLDAVEHGRGDARWAVGLRADGYWFVPFLRAAGTELDALAAPAAENALARFGGLFARVAAPAPASGAEARDEARRFADGEIAVLVTGPWAIAELGDRDRLAVAGIPHAPRGGHLLVVPRCSPDVAASWRLVETLTSTGVQVALADRFATIPTRADALAQSPALVRALAASLRDASPLPRSPRTPLLFDDLTPAVAAVVLGDATVDEALAGVRRAWSRIAP
jgi:ABC-type glycerol-3-phosphate transport system substrate-binding protein